MNAQSMMRVESRNGLWAKSNDRDTAMPEVQLGHFSGTLGILAQKGVRYSTVIDLGCADGTFYLQHFDRGLLPGSIVVNVEANAMYEPSLREIRQVLGGHYAIAAISDSDGEIELR